MNAKTYSQADLARIDAAIQAQEALRGLISDEQIEAVLETLRSQRVEISLQLKDGAIAIGQDAKAVGAGAALVEGNIGGDLITGRKVITGDISQGEAGTVIAGDVLIYAYNIYTAPSGKPALSQKDFESILNKYLLWVSSAYNKARLYGLESLHSTRDRPVRRLADVFVPITLIYSSQKFPLQELLTKVKDKQIAITGGAGSGKSTLLAYLADCLATSAMNGEDLPFKLPEGRKNLVPVLIPLRYFREYQGLCQQSPQMRLENPRAGTLAGFIPWYLKRRNPALELSEDFFDRLLLGGGCLLMLDGLDEVVSRQERGHMRQQVEDLANDIYPGNLILVTARQAGYQRDAVFGDNFLHMEVGPLEPDQIEALVFNWCSQLFPGEEQLRTRELVTAIKEINALRRIRDTPSLVNTPLMTTMVVSVKWGDTELPRERASLYEAAVKVILQAQYLPEDPARKELVEWGGPWEEQRDWLSLIALEMHRGGKAGASTNENTLRTILDNGYPGVADQFIEAVRMRGGLFEERPEIFQFVHLTFQEFLAARRLAKDREKALAGLEEMITEAWWREVLLLIYGFARQDHTPFAQTYLDWLATRSKSGELRLAGLELAGSALLELERLHPELGFIQATRLVTALTDSRLSASPAIRARAGDTLAKLGDPRFDPRTWYLPGGPQLGFIEIPAGPFCMGSDPNVDKVAIEDEQPQHELNLPTYYMARYLVTVAQFAAFVEISAYAPRDKICLRGLPNHPVVWVTWYDAIAYSDWLGVKLRGLAGEKGRAGEASAFWQGLADGKLHVTLPSEAEWEKAARGVDRRIYPWGNDFEPKKANVANSIGATSAVGCFAQGVSPFGVEDLSGNVSEWTRSILGDFPYPSDQEAKEKREDLSTSQHTLRVLRGGSFYNNRMGTRSAYRYGLDPEGRDLVVGFRVVVSPD